MLFSSARPIKPGKLGRARRLAEELEPHRAEYEALNERFRVGTHAVWVSHPVGREPIFVAMYDMDPDDLRVMRERTWDPEGSAYDSWWLEWCRDVLGVDLLTETGFDAPPESILEWTRAD